MSRVAMVPGRCGGAHWLCDCDDIVNREDTVAAASLASPSSPSSPLKSTLPFVAQLLRGEPKSVRVRLILAPP